MDRGALFNASVMIFQVVVSLGSELSRARYLTCPRGRICAFVESLLVQIVPIVELCSGSEPEMFSVPGGANSAT